MYCKNCGTKLDDSAIYCEACGTKLVNDTNDDINQNNILENSASIDIKTSEVNNFYAKETFSKPAMLILAIVTSVALLFTLINKNYYSSISLILATISTWLIWSNAKSSKPLSKGGYVIAKVLLQIKYILLWIISGVISVVSVIILILGIIGENIISQILQAPQFQEYLYKIYSMLTKYNIHINFNELFYLDTPVLIIISVVLMIALLACVAVIIVFNIVFIRKFLTYSNTLIKGIKSGENFPVYNKNVAVSLLVYGIITSVSALPTALMTIGSSPIESIAIITTISLPIIAYCVINGSTDKK